MIHFEENKVNINGIQIEFSIRVKKVIKMESYILICLAYEYDLDVGLEWQLGGKEKWNDINNNYKKPTLFCYGIDGKLIWEFSLLGFVSIAEIDESIRDRDSRLQNWLNENKDVKDVFLVYHDSLLIMNYKTGEIYEKLEIR